MSALGPVQGNVLRRDRHECTACRNAVRPLLAVHHMVPVHLGGSDSIANLTTLCANCHRLVHWLATGDRIDSLGARGLGLGKAAVARVRFLALKIRRRRVKEFGGGRIQLSSMSLSEAMRAIEERHGLEQADAALMRRCVKRIFASMRPEERQTCSRRLVRGALFMSVNAGNHLVARVPAWDDDRAALEADLLLIWPLSKKPSIWTEAEWRRRRGFGFAKIPYTNIGLSWNECLSLRKADWAVYRRACDDALNIVRTRSWPTNVRLV